MNNIRYADNTTLMAGGEDKLENLFLRVKEMSDKTCLKFSIQKTKIMASSPINSWQIEEGKVETVTYFVFLGLKTTADGDYGHESKTIDPLKENYNKPRQHIKKQRHHMADIVCIARKMVFQVVMFRCESQTIKKAEH